jgi:hypothetical protein
VITDSGIVIRLFGAVITDFGHRDHRWPGVQ